MYDKARNKYCFIRDPGMTWTYLSHLRSVAKFERRKFSASVAHDSTNDRSRSFCGTFVNPTLVTKIYNSCDVYCRFSVNKIGFLNVLLGWFLA